MDLFGFKRRRAARQRAEAQATARGAALEKFIADGDAMARESLVRQQRAVPQPPPRRRRPEADAPERLYGGGFSPLAGDSMAVDNTLASWAQPVNDDSDRSSRHSAPDPAPSRSDDSDSSGYTNTDSYTNTDGGYSSGSSSSYDSGSSSSYDSGSSGSW